MTLEGILNLPGRGITHSAKPIVKSAKISSSYHPRFSAISAKAGLYLTMGFLLLTTLLSACAPKGVNITDVTCSPDDPSIVAAVQRYNSSEGMTDHIEVQIPPEYVGGDCELWERTVDNTTGNTFNPAFYSLLSKDKSISENWLDYVPNSP
jgi:hypothetical protein